MPAKIIIKTGKEKKIRNFYPSVYKDEIDEIIGTYKNGDILDLIQKDGTFIAKAYINENASAVARVLSLKDEEIDKKFIKEKIKTAYEKRKFLEKETNSYRVFFSEADFLPGLVVDKFGDYLSVQFRTLGIENFRQEIIRSLKEVIRPKGIYERSDVETRIKEGTEEEKGILFGEIPKEIIMEDNDLKFIVDIEDGQKTGFFLDQRDSRKFIRKYLNKNMSFLDVFSSTGGFSMAALKEGCERVIAIDKNPYALELAKKNYELNEFKNKFETFEGDAFSILKTMSQRNMNFDVITLDPPSLIKRKQDVNRGRDFFYNLCNDSIKLINDGGILGVITCAYHLSLNDLIEVSRMAASNNSCVLEVIGVNYQPADHPWILHIPETLYLKALWLKIIKK